MLHEILRATQDFYGISGKDLAEAAGMSAQHVSEFRRAKSDMTASRLWDLLCALEKLAPGAMDRFAAALVAEIRAEGSPKSLLEQLDRLIEAADQQELACAMLAIAKRWNESLQPAVIGRV